VHSPETGPRLVFERKGAGLLERAVARLLHDLAARELHLVRVKGRDRVNTDRPSGAHNVGRGSLAQRDVEGEFLGAAAGAPGLWRRRWGIRPRLRGPSRRHAASIGPADGLSV